jgi:hypothetical protein
MGVISPTLIASIEIENEGKTKREREIENSLSIETDRKRVENLRM